MKDDPKTEMTSRRELLFGGAAAVAAGAVAGGFGISRASADIRVPALGDAAAGYRYCLNMSTVRGQELTIEEEVDVAGKAGYGAIEPWMGKILAYVEKGGKLGDLRKRIEDFGMTVESAIGFAKWIVDDDAERAKGLEEAKRDMGMLAEIGAKRIAAPPAGATNEGGLDLFKAAERYRALLELGDEMGVVPQVEVWGFSKNLSRLGESVFVAVESGHPKACLLSDVYHIYKGGSEFAGMGLLSAQMMQVMHMNDYPEMEREKIADADRVWPGDGVAPISEILQMMAKAGARPVLSLELFNKEYWKMAALDAAKMGLEKMKVAVAEAGV